MAVTKRLLSLFIVCVFFTGCSKQPSEEITYGTFKDSEYLNKYFGLSVKMPPDWNIQDKAAQQRLQKIGTEMVFGEDKSAQALIKASEIDILNLFMVYKHPLGSLVSFNPNILCIAEKIDNKPGIKQGKDYLFHYRKNLEASKASFSFTDEIASVQLGGVDFDVLDGEMLIMGHSIKQKTFAAIKKGYAIIFAISYLNDSEAAELERILNTITFE